MFIVIIPQFQLQWDPVSYHLVILFSSRLYVNVKWQLKNAKCTPVRPRCTVHIKRQKKKLKCTTPIFSNLHRHGLRTPNEGINQRYLKNWADVADKICFGHTYLKIWEWEWIFGRAVKAISSLGVRSPCS